MRANPRPAPASRWLAARSNLSFPSRNSANVRGRLRSEVLANSERLQTAAENRPPLRPGCAGPAVAILQEVLRGRGFSVARDAIYGQGTANAVRQFQRAHDLAPVDGIAGSSVLTTLDMLLLRVELPVGDVMPLVRPAAQDAFANIRGAPPPWHAAQPEDDPVCRKTYAATTTLLKRLTRAAMQTLRAFGCGTARSRPLFEVKLSGLLARVQAEHPMPVQSRRAGVQRRELLRMVLRAFGASPLIPTEAQEAMLSAPGVRPSFFGRPKLMQRIFAASCAFYSRLEGFERVCMEPYRTREQLFALLAEFPALADDAYAEAGLSGVSGFPPVARAGATRQAQWLARTGANWVAAQEREATLQTVGLVVAGVAVGILSFGLLSGLGATLATMGFGLAQSSTRVVDRSLALQHAEDARAIGAGSDALVDWRRAELGGAWAGLLIDAVSMRWGAAIGASVGRSTLTKYLAVNAIDASGNAASMLADPAVRESPDVVGTVLFGIVVSYVAGEATIHAGGRIQLVLSKGGRIVEGARVRVATAPEQPVVDGVVTSVHGSTIGVRVPAAETSAEITVEVDRAARVRVRDPAGGSAKVLRELAPKLQSKASAVPGSCSATNKGIGGMIFVETGGAVRPNLMRDDRRFHTYLETGDGTLIDGAYYQFFAVGAERPRVFVGSREEFLAELRRLHAAYGWNVGNRYIGGRLEQLGSVEQFFSVYYERATVGLPGETLYAHPTRHGPRGFYRGE